MKHYRIIIALGVLTLSLPAAAQNSVRMPDPFARLKPSEKKDLVDQAASFFDAAKPAVATISKSTVVISYRGNQICFGTVVTVPDKDKPVILTKWSEVKNARTRLVVTNPAGQSYPATVTGVYPEHDLALLAVNLKEAKLKPLDLNQSATPALGEFIALARPDGNVEGFGVVSVLARSLREKDKAYLGVLMDFTQAGKNGVPLKQVMPDSAAEKAGLRDGDVIVTVDDTTITGAMEMRNLLQRLEPGSEINIRYRRGGEEKNATVHLGSRADNTNIRRIPRERMSRMERMGTVPSHVRTDFPSVIQSDMPISPHDTGAPVADLDGNIVGIAIARGSRIKSYIIPTASLRTILASKPQSLSGALAMADNRSNPRYSRPYSTPRDLLPPQARRIAPRAVPQNNDDMIDQVRRLLDQTRRNNDENAENLRRIQDALRKLNQSQQDSR
ncbi:MAG: PDZ domain-containing protein [Verrucomicrobiae bacterium]|nr:PDZ domain-containing protein [Verrucomicrobiae bacterium]NNJ87596.1 PDZ domain-containing protein [Akkermansiaceae bacterium]